MSLNTEAEQEEIGPRIQQTQTPAERMARRMRLRDDEDLALVQLEAAERDSEREWYGTQRTVAEQIEESHDLERSLDVAGEEVDLTMLEEELTVPEWLGTLDTEPGQTALPFVSPLREELAQAREEMQSIHAFLRSDTLAAARRYTAIPKRSSTSQPQATATPSP